MSKILLPVIAGPTASGKSDVAVELALRLNGEVVSADSMQIYRYMDIGTAKVNSEIRSKVRHHLLDVVNPDENFSLAVYQKLALSAIMDIHSRGRVPLLTGGTGLYIKAIIDNYPLDELPQDPECRLMLQKMWTEKGAESMYARLNQVDPEYAGKITAKDKRRIIRALEVYSLSGRGPSIVHAEAREKSPFTPVLIGLTTDREKLYDRINRRARSMISSGLLAEYNYLISLGFAADTNAMQGLGYRHAYMYNKGIWSESEMLDNLQRDTRRYAKRQLTWFRAMEGIVWLEHNEFWNTVDIISELIAGKSKTILE